MSPLIQEVEEDVPSLNVPTTLDLTPVESTLRRLLLDVATYIDESPPPSSADSQVSLPDELANEKITLRFTGGWVRDKLLGVPSHDIDVAINKMTGYAFGLRLKDYLEQPGIPEKYGLEGVAKNDKQSQKAGTTDKSKTVGGLHKIEANPEKSKHLETVTTTILGLDIDLVNLRKETYTDDSRNPQMEFGTPEEDALRRDATVNAMFYNINTERIEDFTGQGHQDMQKKIIRTPLEPYQTFKDDPLRVLRLIRFASRLDYRIEGEALEAMRNDEIKDALRRKISRERVGIEMEKCLRGPDPYLALQLVDDLGLYETIFCDPTSIEKFDFKPDTENYGRSIDTLQDEMQDKSSELGQLARQDDENRFLAWHISALVPYRDAPQEEASEPGRRAPPPLATQVAREGLKATNKVCEIVTASVRNRADIVALVEEIVALNKTSKGEEKTIETERARLGMTIRHLGPSWPTQYLYAFLVATLDSGNTETTLKNFSTVAARIFSLSLSDAYNFKPLLDGKALAKALNTKPGPWMKEALDVIMAYQLRNPSTATTEAALEAVETHQSSSGNGNGNTGELVSALLTHFLKLTIRPSFAQTQPASVTSAGRADTRGKPPPKIGMQTQSEADSKPWKHEREAHILDLLQWSLHHLSPTTVEEVWPLVIPPLLTLLDDWEAPYKTLGAQLTHALLQITSPTLLTRTGLGPVFQAALLPCTAFIPPITPEPEAVALLDATLPALLSLHHLRFPTPTPTATKNLTALLRLALLQPLSTSPNSLALTTVLLTHLPYYLDTLGLATIPHVKTLIPMLRLQMTSPTSSLGGLEAAARALGAVVRNAWPRMAPTPTTTDAATVTGTGTGTAATSTRDADGEAETGWWVEVLAALTGAWIKVDGIDSEEGEACRAALRECVRVLETSVQGRVEWEESVGVLVRADGRVGGLFRGLGFGV